MEIMWKQIQEFPKYSVSNTGQVKIEATGKILALSTDKGGYQVVGMGNENGRKMKKVHRLVAEAFIPNPDNLPQVDHRDRNRSNNNLDNLRWASFHSNMQNQSPHRDSNSGYIGVHWSKHMQKWKAGITINGKTKHLGYFTDEQEAAQAYQAARVI